jgi:hypothetical protein
VKQDVARGKRNITRRLIDDPNIDDPNKEEAA